MPKFKEPKQPGIVAATLAGPGGVTVSAGYFSVIDPDTGLEVQRTTTFADALAAQTRLYAAAQARGF